MKKRFLLCCLCCWRIAALPAQGVTPADSLRIVAIWQQIEDHYVAGHLDSAQYSAAEGAAFAQQIGKWDVALEFQAEVSYFMLERGQVQLALDHMKASQEAMKNRVAPEEKAYLSVYNSIGAAYKQLGRYDQALDFFLKAKRLFIQHRGEYDLGQVGLLQNLLDVYMELNDYEQAIATIEQADALAARQPDSLPPNFANFYTTAANYFSRITYLDQALQYLTLARKLVEKHYGPTHPQRATV